MTQSKKIATIENHYGTDNVNHKLCKNTFNYLNNERVDIHIRVVFNIDMK